MPFLLLHLEMIFLCVHLIPSTLNNFDSDGAENLCNQLLMADTSCCSSHFRYIIPAALYNWIFSFHVLLGSVFPISLSTQWWQHWPCHCICSSRCQLPQLPVFCCGQYSSCFLTYFMCCLWSLLTSEPHLLLLQTLQAQYFVSMCIFPVLMPQNNLIICFSKLYLFWHILHCAYLLWYSPQLQVLAGGHMLNLSQTSTYKAQSSRFYHILQFFVPLLLLPNATTPAILLSSSSFLILPSKSSFCLVYLLFSIVFMFVSLIVYRVYYICVF